MTISKKINNISVMCLVAIFFPVIAFAQNPAIDTTTKKIFEPVKVEKGIGGIHAGLIGLWGYYEVGLADRWAFRAEIGAAKETIFGKTFDDGFFNLTMNAVLSAEGKWYYHLSEERDVFTKNSGSFIALKASVSLPFPYIFDNQKSALAIQLFPMWGIRRVWWEHFSLEFGIGVGPMYLIGINHNATAWQVGSGLYLRIGYTF